MAVTFRGKSASKQNPIVKSTNAITKKLDSVAANPTDKDSLSQTSANTAEHPVAASFQHLVGTASQLNSASDHLTSVIDRLDAGLKKLNLGVTAWVEVRRDENPDDCEFITENLGYMRIGSKWGIALRTIEGTRGDDPRNFDDQLWLFTDAPRELRLRAVDKIPKLIAELDRAAKELTKRLITKIDEVNELAAAIESEGDR
jgi:hypothetical protein